MSGHSGRTPLDDPLSNLDAKLRVQMRAELAKLHRRLQVTMIYVTHDQVEAMTMGDRITVMNGGVIQQVDTPRNLYRKPADKFVAGFIGSSLMNYLPATLEERSGALRVRGAGFALQLTEEMRASLAGAAAREVTFGAGAALEGSTPRVLVEVVEPVGGEAYLHLKLGDQSLIARVDQYERIEVGQQLEVGFALDRARRFDPRDERVIA